MKYQLKIIIFFSLLLVSCEKDKLSKTLDFEQFTMEVPSTWKSYPGQGYDSKTGKITNRKDELTYDHGWHSYDFQNETSATHTRTSISIDGKPALIVKPIEKGKGVIGVYIQVDNLNRFNLSGKNIKNEDTVLKIMESVKF